VGLGALIFARHPALHSLATISLFGIVAVVLVSYTIQPVLFRMLITSQTEKGGAPYTLGSLVNTAYAFGLFVTGCQLLQALIFTLWPLPMARRRKQRIVQWSIHHMTRGFLRAMVTTKTIRLNEPGERFEKPAVVIANHQSFIDILVLLSICPKAVMVTNGWVWRSPVFGRIVRYLGFYHAADGYERLAPALAQKVAEGYSVIVFPEGTRSADGKIGRFHKGAFYLAGELGLDILPICLYGNGMISSKRQPIYIKHGLVVSRVLPRMAAADPANCSAQAKAACRLMRREYLGLYETYNRPCNPYFRDMLIKSYTYKGPVLEWYMRVKVRLERSYELFDRIVPRDAAVVDLGCGYGPLSYMLAMLCERRRVIGMDYDAEKVETANRASCGGRASSSSTPTCARRSCPGQTPSCWSTCCTTCAPKNNGRSSGAARHGSTQADGSSSATATAARPSGTRPRR
jgi:1-acyl-sn-glycerol-3-phosphate acyltransferase